MTGRKYGYARVSSSSQNLDRQIIALERLITLLKFFRIISWTIVRNAMIKLSVGCFGHIQTKVTGVEIYTIFSARYVPEWMMR